MLSGLVNYLQQFLHLLLSGSKATYGAVGVAVLVAFLYFKIFFRSSGGFTEDADKASKWPLLDHDWDPVEENWSTMKVVLWVGLSLGSGFIAYYQLPVWFPRWFR